MKKIILGILLLQAIGAHSQKSPIKFGDIPMEDMTMTLYDKDSSAAAVVLSDFGRAYITVNTTAPVLNFERHTRIKILKKEGFDQANVSILLYTAGNVDEKVLNLKASSFNLEGGKIVETKMLKDGVFKEKFNRNYNQQKFTIPNVKEGSVIEYTYGKTSPYFVNFPNWQFQQKIPTRSSEYWAMFPTIFRYQQYMQGYIPVTSYEVNDQLFFGEKVKAHHWISQNIPAFKVEPYMTCEEDYLSKINFALAVIEYSTHIEEIMSTWIKLNEDLLEDENFGKVISGSGFLKDQVAQLTVGLTDPLQKIASISNFIKQNIAWDDIEDFYAAPLKKIVERKSGSSGDINLLYASMLQKAGLDVDMVLLSTRDHGFIRKAYPMRKQFNYVICVVYLDGKTLLLDATEKYLHYDVLPAKCLNGQGLVISKKNHAWIDVTSKAKARTVVSADLILDVNGDLKGNIQYSRDGYDAQNMRELYHKKGEEAYVKEFLVGKQWQVEKSEFLALNELDKQVREKHEINISDHSSIAGSVIYINPFVTTQLEQNPFKSEKREYPVDFGNLFEKTYMCKIILPPGYIVDELPKSRVIVLPGNTGRYIYNASQAGNSINITSTLQINRSTFGQDEYPNLKEFYNQVVAKQAEQIVVKKN